MAKSIPRNFSAGLFSTVWLSQQNKRLAKYFPDGSQLQTSVPSLTGSAGGVLSLWQTSLEASDGYPAKRYSRLLHWSYRNFLHVFLIYSVEIRRMVPGRTSGTHFPDAAAADCFLYLDSLLFIWIDPYFYGAVHSSHPDFLYTAVSFRSVPRLH